MEKRDRDKVNQSDDKPTEVGDVNRETSQRQSNSDLEFGEKIGRSERPEDDEPTIRTWGMTGASSKSEH